MGIESNKEAMAMMKRTLQSMEGKIREAYNKGYHDGLKEGINQTTQKLVSKLLDEVEADTPQTDCDTCKHRAEPNVACDRCDKASHSNYEPQTDCLTCRYNSDEWDSPKCDSCSKAHSNYEPQTDCDDRYAVRTDSGEVVAYACPLGCEQTDCGWRRPDE